MKLINDPPKITFQSRRIECHGCGHRHVVDDRIEKQNGKFKFSHCPKCDCMQCSDIDDNIKLDK